MQGKRPTGGASGYLRAFREHLAQYGGRIEQSVECELDGNYRPVKVRKNYETAI